MGNKLLKEKLYQAIDRENKKDIKDILKVYT